MNKLTPQFCCMLACVAGTALCAPHAGAITVYDNGGPTHDSGNNLNFALQADDFTLGRALDVTGIVFWSLEAAGAYRGSISWAIVADAGGVPGDTPIAAARQAVTTRTSTGNYLGLSEYRNDLTLSTPVPLTPGNYWLVLHNGGPGNFSDSAEYLWEQTAPGAHPNGQETFSINGVWTSTGSEHAFALAAVPEPQTVTMLLAGIAAVAGIQLRRRNGGVA